MNCVCIVCYLFFYKDYCADTRVFTTVLFKGESLHWNHFAAFICLVLAVYFVFYK